MQQKKYILSVFCLLALIGISLLIKANYLSLKATLAQVLIQRAWQQSIVRNSAVKPWPWADTSIAGKLSIGDNDLMVLEGANLRNLAFGPARLSSSVDIFETGNLVIFGHRDTHFAPLQYLRIGDKITFEHHDLKIYEISEIAIVADDQVAVTSPTMDDVITLITCYPFEGLSSDAEQRYVVRAHAVTK